MKSSITYNERNSATDIDLVLTIVYIYINVPLDSYTETGNIEKVSTAEGTTSAISNISLITTTLTGE